MKVAILADVHDRLDRLAEALDKARGADALLCLGDLCSPFVMAALGEGFQGPTHVVFGNNDGDRFRITLQAKKYPHVTLHGEFGEVEMGGKRFALVHFPEIARPLAQSDRYDVVCYGHDHTLSVERAGQTWLVNPGEIMGVLEGRSTFIIYDTETDEPTVVDLA